MLRLIIKRLKNITHTKNHANVLDDRSRHNLYENSVMNKVLQFHFYKTFTYYIII